MAFLELQNITKRYDKLLANDNVSLSVEKGEIHSLLGENGAGKTTLMNILYCMTAADSGKIFIDGVLQQGKTPHDAIKSGICMVHQHFMLVEPLTVYENIALGYEKKKGAFFDKKTVRKEVAELAEKYGFELEVDAKVSSLSVGTKQRVEILKALYRKSDIIILDEPTAVLTALETEDLFKVLKSLKQDGKTIIIITHKLKEIMQVSDRVTIMRSGRHICTKNTADTNPQELAELMVGRSVQLDYNNGEPPREDAEVLLEFRDVHYHDHKVKSLNGLNLKIRAGEIYGVCGVEGNGQTQLIEIATGILSPKGGELIVRGKPVKRATPTKMMLENHVAHIPEDRGTRGLVKDFSIEENMILGYQRIEKFQKKGILKLPALEAYAHKLVGQFGIKIGEITDPVSSLSGGNQQKVVLGRALSRHPSIVVAAQPTRGVDIGAIEYIHAQLIRMKSKGRAVLLVSAELDEILALSDRIGVLYNGKIVAEGKKSDFDEMKLGMLMTGYNLAESI